MGRLTKKQKIKRLERIVANMDAESTSWFKENEAAQAEIVRLKTECAPHTNLRSNIDGLHATVAGLERALKETISSNHNLSEANVRLRDEVRTLRANNTRLAAFGRLTPDPQPAGDPCDAPPPIGPMGGD